MKKVLLSVVAMLLLFAGVVGAASINGEFEGNPIIKVKSNGQVLPIEDTPAILYNDRTMVPIYMLRQLGLEVNWIADEYAVDVKYQQNIETKTNEDYEFLGSALEIMDQYKNLEDVGEYVDSISNLFNIAFDEIDYYGTNDNLIKLSKKLEEVSDTVSEKEKIINSNSDKWIKQGFKIDNMYTIIDHYKTAIEYFNFSKSGLDQFYIVKSDENFNKYLNNSSKAFDETLEGRELSTQTYGDFVYLLGSYLNN